VVCSAPTTWSLVIGCGLLLLGARLDGPDVLRAVLKTLTEIGRVDPAEWERRRDQPTKALQTPRKRQESLASRSRWVGETQRARVNPLQLCRVV
jgi:hypothetical protein